MRVDATKFEGWFYEGAGIYRHVWLDKTAPVAIAPDGIFVYSQFQEQRAGRTRRKSTWKPTVLNTLDQRREGDRELRNHFAGRQIRGALQCDRRQVERRIARRR